MKKMYTYVGCGVELHECMLNEETQVYLENDCIYEVLCYLIDTDQISYYNIDDTTEQDLCDMEENCEYEYIDNTSSEFDGKKSCFYVYVGNLRIEEKEDK
jgi:hypothetical protein